LRVQIGEERKRAWARVTGSASQLPRTNRHARSDEMRLSSGTSGAAGHLRRATRAPGTTWANRILIWLCSRKRASRPPGRRSSGRRSSGSPNTRASRGVPGAARSSGGRSNSRSTNPTSASPWLQELAGSTAIARSATDPRWLAVPARISRRELPESSSAVRPNHAARQEARVHRGGSSPAPRPGPLAAAGGARGVLGLRVLPCGRRGDPEGRPPA
jgi:hypothetical protein